MLSCKNPQKNCRVFLSLRTVPDYNESSKMLTSKIPQKTCRVSPSQRTVPDYNEPSVMLHCRAFPYQRTVPGSDEPWRVNLQGVSISKNGTLLGVMGGCLPAGLTCDSGLQGQQCEEVDGVGTRCHRCCHDGQQCNTWLQELPSAAQRKSSGNIVAPSRVVVIMLCLWAIGIVMLIL